MTLPLYPNSKTPPNKHFREPTANTYQHTSRRRLVLQAPVKQADDCSTCTFMPHFHAVWAMKTLVFLILTGVHLVFSSMGGGLAAFSCVGLAFGISRACAHISARSLMQHLPT